MIGVFRRSLRTWRSGLARKRDRRRSYYEAELDRREAELRASIYELTSELSKAGLDARREMIRQAYLASGRTFKGE